jgi:hypothetical protein
MKRTVWLSLAVLAVLVSAISIQAQDASKAAPMTGFLCNSKCVKQSSGSAACDQNCAEKSGEIVLIDDQGRVLKIANQEKVAPHAGKKVKMMCKPVPGQDNTMYVDSLSLYGG